MSALTSYDYLEQWEHLIDTANKSTVPTRFIGRIILNYNDEDNARTIDVTQLRHQGYSDEGIEEIIAEVMQENTNNGVCAMEFYVDILAVADTVQELTDKILQKI